MLGGSFPFTSIQTRTVPPIAKRSRWIDPGGEREKRGKKGNLSFSSNACSSSLREPIGEISFHI